MRIYLLLPTIVFAGCLPACTTTNAIDGHAVQTTSVHLPVGAQVAVYRSLIASNASGLQGKTAAYCVGVGAGTKLVDPDRAVLAAMADNPKVKSASACNVSGEGAQVTERQSGQSALLLGLQSVACSSKSECTIDGGYYEGNLSSQRNTYRARLEDGSWTATVETPGAVS